MASVPVLALSIHAGFECRHSGACCAAGWPIPVEADAAGRIRSDGRLPREAVHPTESLPDGAVAIIRPAANGSCPFFEPEGGRLCAIQRHLGHGALPASCRHFPRVALLDPDAVRVSLSHFCPTAASMLFEARHERLAIVDDARGIAGRSDLSGFDARHTIPPLLRPGVAMDHESCRSWERHLLDVFGSGELAPETMLTCAASTADVVRGWSAAEGTLEAHTRRAIGEARAPSRPHVMTLAGASRLFALAARSVPSGLPKPDAPGNAEADDISWVRPRWAGFARPLGRYLAARSFGAWSAYYGEGLRTQVATLAVALAAVRIEAIREAARERRALDESILLAAIRSADLLLHHLSDAKALTRSLAGVERGTLSGCLAFMGLEEAG